MMYAEKYYTNLSLPFSLSLSLSFFFSFSLKRKPDNLRKIHIGTWVLRERELTNPIEMLLFISLSMEFFSSRR